MYYLLQTVELKIYMETLRFSCQREQADFMALHAESVCGLVRALRPVSGFGQSYLFLELLSWLPTCLWCLCPDLQQIENANLLLKILLPSMAPAAPRIKSKFPSLPNAALSPQAAPAIHFSPSPSTLLTISHMSSCF